MQAEVTRVSFLAIQVCVPEEWDDAQIIAFAEQKNPCGTENGWTVRKEGSQWLGGDPARNPCAERESFVHVVLDA